MKEVPTFTFGAQNLPNKEYHQWLIEIKQRFQQSQIKTAIKVNTALLEFYWSLGSDIVKMGIMDKNVAFFGYIASNGQKCCSFLDRYLDNTKNYLTFALSV